MAQSGMDSGTGFESSVRMKVAIDPFCWRVVDGNNLVQIKLVAAGVLYRVIHQLLQLRRQTPEVESQRTTGHFAFLFPPLPLVVRDIGLSASRICPIWREDAP